MGLSGLDELADLEQRLRTLARVVPFEAAKLAASELLKLAESEYAAGESPEGDAWDPLKQGSGVPLRALTSGVTSAADGARVIITTPEPTKYHQGGYAVHTEAAGLRLREAKAEAKQARLDADKERYKAAQFRVRSLKAAIANRSSWATPVVARRTLPKGRAAIPLAWAKVLGDCWDRAMEKELGGAGA